MNLPTFETMRALYNETAEDWNKQKLWFSSQEEFLSQKGAEEALKLIQHMLADHARLVLEVQKGLLGYVVLFDAKLEQCNPMDTDSWNDVQLCRINSFPIFEVKVVEFVEHLEAKARA